MATKHTPELAEAFLAELENSGHVENACAIVGIGKDTAYRWRREDRAFAAAWREAIDRAKHRATTPIDRATRTAEEIMADPKASLRQKVQAARAIGTLAAHGARNTRLSRPAPKEGPSETTLALLAKARADAEAALAPVAERLPEKVRTTALDFITFYNAINAKRGFVMAPHMVPLAVALADDTIRNLLVIIGPGSGKSGVLTTAWPAFVLGRDPVHTVLAVSAGESLVSGFMLSVAGIIDSDPAYRALFPKARPDHDRGWSTERGLFVTGHALGDPDASYYATGVLSSTLTGKHAQTIVLDDIHDRSNSGTAAQCENVVAAFYDTLLGRADPRGARFIVAGRRFSESDLYGHLAASGDFVVMTLPAERPGQTDLWFDIEIPDHLDCVLSTLCEPRHSAEPNVADEPPDIVEPFAEDARQ